MLNHLKVCPCCSGKAYSVCCAPFIENKAIPALPEQLMRSRYTAYTQANINYIGQTMKGPASKGFDPVSAKEWAMQVKWLGLEVLSASPILPGQTRGTVEFIARFHNGITIDQIHEVSEFILENGRWYYVSGSHKNESGG